MGLPSWFQSAIEQRVDQVAAWIERQPELRELRVEERAAFDAMFSDTDRSGLPEYMLWRINIISSGQSRTNTRIYRGCVTAYGL
ncbi:hypothetical protein GCM10008933_16350 [Paenibacillus motobuensis]|uniref:Uncharacterized protein n=1 Tax=Paenibacillus motobuensis TaxID=295324 RepID=A0ABN0Y906_9BACL